ncbi:DUF362 domain-containing protein [Thermodesulfobacteriota bacterium]
MMKERRHSSTTRVSLIHGAPDRFQGVKRAVSLLGVNPVEGKDVLLKPNFNTADPFPASTHNETLAALVGELRFLGAKTVTIGERSGPPDTREVLADKQLPALADQLGVELVNFEELPEEDWLNVQPERSHWRAGFDVARPVLDAQSVVTTCCLKTHRYGGIFTMSLKLSVGMVHKRNMGELHGAQKHHMMKMIAEINQVYTPDLVVMDGTEVFVDGGPMQGERKKADMIFAATDRIALDAVGLALLKYLGSNRHIMEIPIFKQEQIARAVELGLGVSDPRDIEIVSDDSGGRMIAAELTKILAADLSWPEEFISTIEKSV